VAKASSQKFIARNRAPRVQIEYDVELYGSEKKIQLPFVMGVLADLSGKPAEPLPPVADRKFLEIDVDNFDSRMKAMKPRVAFAVPNTLTGDGNLNVELTFESMGDFSPAAVARKVDAIVTSGGGPSARAAKSATSTIPIFFIPIQSPTSGLPDKYEEDQDDDEISDVLQCHRPLISRTKIQMIQKPPVRTTMRQSSMNFQKPYFLRQVTTEPPTAGHRTTACTRRYRSSDQ